MSDNTVKLYVPTLVTPVSQTKLSASPFDLPSESPKTSASGTSSDTSSGSTTPDTSVPICAVTSCGSLNCRSNCRCGRDGRLGNNSDDEYGNGSASILQASYSATGGGELSDDVWSRDFLGFSFNGRSYESQLETGRLNTGKTSGVSIRIRSLQGIDVVWIAHEFKFIGGSLGCAEGELICRAFEKAEELGLPVVVVARSGGARMQEGTLALMQMAKVSAAVSRYRQSARQPYISVCLDPTFGGVTASYAMQGDVRIALRHARIGFAGESVILNTVYKMDQAAYDRDCPPGFQTAPFVQQHGQLDLLVEDEQELEDVVVKICTMLAPRARARRFRMPEGASEPIGSTDFGAKPEGYEPDYTRARNPSRIQPQDIVSRVFDNFVELAGDGRVGYDRCLRGGIALLDGAPCVVVATYKGHNAAEMREANFGMASPAGYRTADRLFRLAEHFCLPVVTLVDTPGAFPSFGSEVTGQPEAIATCLATLCALRVPVVTLFVGEGGSGGALAIAVANQIGMLSDGYYGVITPEGAASILCRYPTDEAKAQRFPSDCREIARAQHIYAEDLQKLQVVDRIVWETPGETYLACDTTLGRVKAFLLTALAELSNVSPTDLVYRRRNKFRKMGKFGLGGPLTSRSPEATAAAAAAAAEEEQRRKRRRQAEAAKQPLGLEYEGILHFLADVVVNGPHSVLYTKVPPGVAPVTALAPSKPLETPVVNAKYVLDKEGPAALSAWVRKQQKLLITDTSMRDAHQSTLATRVRTADLMCVAEETGRLLKDAFSIEMWGGATFDVCMRFLHEDPWRRLRLLREKIPHVCFQMLLRGSNAVGYKSYPDNVIREFIRLAARNGIDVFRIFDCFNDIKQMRLCIETVASVGKVAEVCICFTGNFLSPAERIYTLDYYRNLAREIAASGAHIIGIKDMAGLFRPQMVAPFMAALREVTDLPVHFHTHNTSGASFATLLELSRCGCDIVDVASASMSDTTSQPSLNALLAALEGGDRDAGIDWRALEPLDRAWAAVRAQYFMLESGLKSGTASVYSHQIPGGQYSNLIAQCKALGIWSKWPDVLEMYHKVNLLFGDIVKVTPSSKCVGDMALFLINKNLTVDDVLERGDTIDFPQSVVDLFRGALGFPHHGFPKRVSDAILKGEEPMKDRPGALLPPADFAAEKAKLEEEYARDFSDEEVISSLLYPQQFRDFIAFTKDNGGELFLTLPTYYYNFGLRIGASFYLQTPGCSDPAPKGAKIMLQRVGPLSEDNMRTVAFQVTPEGASRSQRHEVKIRERRKASEDGDDDDDAAAMAPVANPDDPSQIPSPLPGVVDKISVCLGDRVKKGQMLLSVAAMKMEVQVVAPFDGIVDRLCVSVGSKVNNKTLLAQVKETK